MTAPTTVAAVSARRVRLSSQRPLSRALLAVILVVWLAAWEVGVRAGVIDEDFFPAPSAVATALGDMATDSAITSVLAETGITMAVATAYGLALGIVLGYLMGFFAILRDAFLGPALFLLSVPKSIFIPIFMLAFGLDQRTAMYYGAFSGFIYVLVNVVSGFDLIEAQQLRMARAFGAGVRHRIVDVILPASLPGLFTGIWYGIKSGVEGILILELFVSITGLGRLINTYTNELRTERVYALIFFFSVIAILLGTAWNAVEGRLTRWRPRLANGGGK